MKTNGLFLSALLLSTISSWACSACGNSAQSDRERFINDSIQMHILDSLRLDSIRLADSLRIDSLNNIEEYRTDTIHVNGVSLFYEVKGKGKPVIVAHGNGGSHKDLDSLMNVLARNGYKVYGIDSRGQGANKPIKEYHYKDMAEDLYQFICRKELHKPAIYGWSDGGNLALQMEVMYPGTCGLIITSGANIFPDGWGGHKNIVNRIKSDPHPKPLRKMLYYEPTMTWHDMTTIQCPVKVCAGENDVILRSHTKCIADSIPNAELHIVKGANHTSYVKHSARVAAIVLDFLKKNNY